MQKKKLLLLSAIVLLMGTNSYGTLYPNAGNNYTISQEDIKDKNLAANTVISITKGNYGIVDESVNIDMDYNGKEDKKIINIGKDTSKDKESVNKGVIGGKTSSGNLVVVGIQGGKFVNNGTIGIAGTNGKGINITGDNKTGIAGQAENNGTIEVNGGATGIYLNHTNATFTNNETGVITVTGNNSKGIEVNKGKAENNGSILVTGDKNLISGTHQAIGVKVNKDGNFVNNEVITVEANGKDSAYQTKGIFVDVGGTATNEKGGEINVSNAGIGALVKGTFTNNGIIKADEKSKGIILSGGILVNSGEISGGKVAIESANKTNNTIYLKNGSKVEGEIKGHTGIDVLALEGNGNGEGEYSNLNISRYEAISVRNGDAKISNSTIALEYNKNIGSYLEKSKSELDKLENISEKKVDNTGNLTMKDSNLIIDFKDSLTNPEATTNPIIDTGSLTFDGKTSFVLKSDDGRTDFDVNEALGIENINTDNMKLDSTAIWDYDITDGKITAKKQEYIDVITKSELNEFVSALEGARKNLNGEFFEGLAQLELLETADEFTKAMAQMSGGLHGYTVDMAAINSRTLVNTMKNRALTREYLTARPVNSWYQDVIYLDNNHRLGGLMSSSYQENGVLGVSEKQTFTNAKMGIVYGGSRGNAKFDGGDSGEIKNDNIYIGLYYNHNFNEKLALNTNFSFVYGHNNVTRNVKFGTTDYSFDSSYPTFAMGIGTSAIYTIKDDVKNKASFYAGIDVNRIMQGNINEEADKAGGLANELTVRNLPVNENSYYSITPSAGFMVQNTGYIWDRKYIIGADLAWETEIGNIKDGKQVNIQKPKDPNKDLGQLVKGYKVGTVERENVFSTSIFGQLDMTESLALNGRYTSSISDDYDADMVTLGMTYKMDTMLDVPVLGPLVSGIENSRSLVSSDRWGGTFALMMEAEDDSDRVYYSTKDGSLNSSDYATSIQMKPKFILSLNDKKTNWSYYFEGYYKANDFLKDTRAGEADQKATRLHGEARWNDSYSKGRYGMAFGYRHETANKPVANQYVKPQRGVRGVHQLRLTPNFSYNLGHGFTMNFKTTGIFEYNYTGVREGQMDFLMENEHTLVYTGFMPRWTLRMGYFREDRWMDSDSNKLVWNSGSVKEAVGAGRYQLNQLRPSATYYLGNGDSVTLSLRIPLGNGAWYNEVGTDKKGSESYETRYSIDYNHVVTPGFSVFGGITFLDIKTKNTDRTNANFGKVSRAYSFRPKLGFSYSF